MSQTAPLPRELARIYIHSRAISPPELVQLAPPREPARIYIHSRALSPPELFKSARSIRQAGHQAEAAHRAIVALSSPPCSSNCPGDPGFVRSSTRSSKCGTHRSRTRHPQRQNGSATSGLRITGDPGPGSPTVRGRLPLAIVVNGLHTLRHRPARPVASLAAGLSGRVRGWNGCSERARSLVRCNARRGSASGPLAPERRGSLGHSGGRTPCGSDTRLQPSTRARARTRMRLSRATAPSDPVARGRAHDRAPRDSGDDG
jgi:hypothetical protein